MISGGSTGTKVHTYKEHKLFQVQHDNSTTQEVPKRGHKPKGKSFNLQSKEDHEADEIRRNNSAPSSISRGSDDSSHHPHQLTPPPPCMTQSCTEALKPVCTLAPTQNYVAGLSTPIKRGQSFSV